MKTIGTLKIKIKIDLSIWDAVKLRIAGIGNLSKQKKITIEEMINENSRY